MDIFQCCFLTNYVAEFNWWYQTSNFGHLLPQVPILFKLRTKIEMKRLRVLKTRNKNDTSTYRSVHVSLPSINLLNRRKAVYSMENIFQNLGNQYTQTNTLESIAGKHARFICFRPGINSMQCTVVWSSLGEEGKRKHDISPSHLLYAICF